MVGSPATSMLSLTAATRPASGSSAPPATRVSIPAASARASPAGRSVIQTSGRRAAPIAAYAARTRSAALTGAGLTGRSLGVPVGQHRGEHLPGRYLGAAGDVERRRRSRRAAR